MNSKRRTKSGYCIFIQSLWEGSLPLEFDENSNPVVYSTINEAQKSIAEDRIERLYQFIEGERDYDDAIAVEEYVVPVQVFLDGSVVEVEE